MLQYLFIAWKNEVFFEGRSNCSLSDLCLQSERGKCMCFLKSFRKFKCVYVDVYACKDNARKCISGKVIYFGHKIVVVK